MDADAVTTFHRLVKGGFALSCTDDDRLAVCPADRLTDDLRDNIRKNKPILLQMLREEADTIREAIMERAAIIEYDAGATRPVADDQACAGMRVYRYRLTDRPATWLALIAPGLDPAEAHRHLVLRFGPARVLEVAEYRANSANRP